ncbi:sensor histidine kinase [Bifidobacterium goeldii]|nr:histidine kinase [Bifidobacterium goeldii]
MSRVSALYAYPDSGWVPSGVLTVMCSYLVAMLAGFAVSEHVKNERLRHTLEEQRQIQMERDRLYRDVRLASTIHDSTTRSLTLISLLAIQCKNEMQNNDDECSAKMDLIHSTAQQALSEVREVIDALDTGSDPKYKTTKNPTKTLQDELQRIVTDNDNRMNIAGVFGISQIECSYNPLVQGLDPRCTNEISSFIDHMYTNILSHGRKGEDSYYVHIRLLKSKIVIYQFNVESTFSSYSYAHSGKGLALHKLKILSLGGTFTANSEDGLWVMTAEIPMLQINEGHKTT